MARKTNKTNHVLGLLAGKDDGIIEEKAPGSEKQTPKETKGNKPAAPNVQIVAKQDEDDAIADKVKQLLEEELEKEAIETPEPIKTAADEKDEIENEMNNETEEDIQADVQLEIEEPVVQETIEREAEKMQDIVEETTFSKDAQKELEKLEKEAKTAATESDYVFLNVMEQLVRDIADKYILQFGTCTCSRCRADVIALALTNLPPKYEVVASNAAAPLLNFYSRQFEGAVRVEVTKACTMVRERPHHNRD